MLSIVMFSTSTCAHCKPLKATLETLEYEYDESELELSYVVIDKQENGMALANEWQVAAVPTLLFIDNGNLLARTTGNRPIEELRAFILEFLNKKNVEPEKDGTEIITCGV